MKIVKVHTCYSIELGEPRPVDCKCRKSVSPDQAKDMVAKGLAQYVIGYDRPKAYEDGDQICLTNRLLRTPRGATIEKAHIERAYLDGDLEERYRINMYGLLTLLARVQQGKTFVGHGPEPARGFNEDWGVPVLTVWSNERTEGGRG